MIDRLSNFTGRPGQPAYMLDDTQLLFLLSLNLSVPRIAHLLGVSSRTVSRGMERYGLSVRNRYCVVSGDELDGLVTLIVHRFPNAGYRMIQAHLRSIGLNVQESLVRASVQRVDPLGVASRRSRHRCIQRRVYSVPHPNALWHINGNLSLIHGDSPSTALLMVTVGWYHTYGAH